MPQTILIVEDHDFIRVSLQRWLAAQFRQCRVIAAASGEEAIALVSLESPNLVVMDIGLPSMNGIEATQRIRAILPSSQVVMLTLHEDDTYRASATAAGASGFVPKRLMETALVPTLAALLADGQAEKEVRNED